MVCSVLEVPARHGHLCRDALSTAFAAHRDPGRAYGADVRSTRGHAKGMVLPCGTSIGVLRLTFDQAWDVQMAMYSGQPAISLLDFRLALVVASLLERGTYFRDRRIQENSRTCLAGEVALVDSPSASLQIPA